MERKIDFTIRFYIYRNFKDESIYYVHVCIFFFSQRRNLARDEKNETKRQKQ